MKGTEMPVSIGAEASEVIPGMTVRLIDGYPNWWDAGFVHEGGQFEVCVRFKREDSGLIHGQLITTGNPGSAFDLDAAGHMTMEP